MGHGCYPPQKVLQGSPTVFIEGLPAHRVGDAIQPHCCDHCHPSFAAMGSSTVFVNGQPLMRIGDSANCGSKLMTGAMTVLAG
ncbi:PAAR motif of membrane protein [Xanthomonas phage X1]|nr:PAAR motif of membrane protein [Xanthomonas phage X1]